MTENSKIHQMIDVPAELYGAAEVEAWNRTARDGTRKITPREVLSEWLVAAVEKEMPKMKKAIAEHEAKHGPIVHDEGSKK